MGEGRERIHLRAQPEDLDVRPQTSDLSRWHPHSAFNRYMVTNWGFGGHCWGEALDRLGAKWWRLRSEVRIKKPTGCLLGACSGRQPVGYRFSLLTLLFSGVFADNKPKAAKKFRPPPRFLEELCNLIGTWGLLRNGRRPGEHQLSKAGILAQFGELGVLVNVINGFVPLL